MKDFVSFRSMSGRKASFESISSRFSGHLDGLKSYLKSQAAAFGDEIRDSAAQCVSPQGKYLRPLLAFSCAPSCGADDARLLNRAATVELIHLASLIHDDVIDNADLRRGSETAFKRFGARTAVLLGDAIFARAMQMAFLEDDSSVWSRSVDAVKTLCEGEIRQSLARSAKCDMRRYLSVIEGKTASLFEFACFMGASLESGSDSPWARAAEEAGRRLGRAYQMYDDVCDWTMTEKESGKTSGTDFIFEKHTLPVLILLESLPEGDAERLSAHINGTPMESLRRMMRERRVIERCADFFDDEIRAALGAVAAFPEKNGPMKEFCREMTAIMPRSSDL